MAFESTPFTEVTEFVIDNQYDSFCFTNLTYVFNNASGTRPGTATLNALRVTFSTVPDEDYGDEGCAWVALTTFAVHLQNAATGLNVVLTAPIVGSVAEFDLTVDPSYQQIESFAFGRDDGFGGIFTGYYLRNVTSGTAIADVEVDVQPAAAADECFWTNYIDTFEQCVDEPSTVALNSFAFSHPEDLNGTVFDSTTSDFTMALLGISGAAYMTPGATTLTNPITTEPVPTTAYVFFTSNVDTIGTPTSGQEARYDPDHIDFFFLTGPGDTVTAVPAAVSAGSFALIPGSIPFSHALTDQGGGLWRLRLSGFASHTWVWASSGGETSSPAYGTIVDAQNALSLSGGVAGNAFRWIRFDVDVAVNGDPAVTHNIGWTQSCAAG